MALTSLNDKKLMADYSSEVDIGMAFPYSQGSRNEVPLRRQTHNIGSNPAKNQRANGMEHGDGLVESTHWSGKSASLNLGDHAMSAYRVEHIASFQHDTLEAELSPADALARLKAITDEGGLWTQVMSMKITDEMIRMSNGDTMELIEEYPLTNINLCTHIINHPVLKNLFIFSTKFSAEKTGAIHLFKCKNGEAAIISSDVNKRRELNAKTMMGAVTNGGYAHESNGTSSPDSDRRSSLKQTHGVHQRIEAFKKIAESPPSSANVTRSGSKTAADIPIDVQEARINRDVECLNRCVEEIELFIFDLKATNEARKKLNKKGRKSTKKKYDGTRIIAKGPEERSVRDIYQKFKYAFNLLARLKTHISNPNASELLHYLIVPLDIIVKMNGLESARTVMVPWLSVAAIELLSSCLDSRETSFWKSLGQYWNLPHSSPAFKDTTMIIYTPVFKDGWSPQEIITDDRNAAAAKSAASMVARMKIVEAEEETKKKALEEKRLSIDVEKRATVTVEPEATEPIAATTFFVETPRRAEEKVHVISGTGKQASVAYDYWAHNNKELTIRAGEKVLVLDDSRRWWLVKNDHDEQGYVPSTVLEFTDQDTNSDSSSADGSTAPHSPFNTVSSGQMELKLQPAPSYVQQKPEAVSPTVVTAKSIITESAQFSAPSSPSTSAPPPVSPKNSAPPVLPKPVSQDKEVDPPQFMPPPPPIVEPVSPRIVIGVSDLKKSPVIAKKEEPAVNFQSELNTRLTTPQMTNGNSLTASDGVDFFIPLFKSSTADDVSRWLKKLGFEPLTIERLKGTAAKELFKIPEDDLVTRLGEEEGKRLHNELEAQIGAQTRHKTMTEFQKALVQRMKRQEIIQKNVKMHHVVIKPSGAGSAPNQEDMQKKFIEQQALLKAQQSGGDSVSTSREPEKPSFTSFSAPANNNEFDFTSEANKN